MPPEPARTSYDTSVPPTGAAPGRFTGNISWLPSAAAWALEIVALLTAYSCPSASITSKPLSVACASAPPPTLVAVSASKSAFEPSATVSVSPAPSVPGMSAAAVISTVAVWAPAPENSSVGLSVPAPEIDTRALPAAPAFFASVTSPAAIPAPDSTSGTRIASAPTSARPSVTVNSAFDVASPSVIAPVLPAARASVTTVGSSSRITQVRLWRLPLLASARFRS